MNWYPHKFSSFFIQFAYKNERKGKTQSGNMEPDYSLFGAYCSNIFHYFKKD